MKKLLLILSIIFCFFLVTSCNLTEDEVIENEDKQEENTNQDNPDDSGEPEDTHESTGQLPWV